MLIYSLRYFTSLPYPRPGERIPSSIVTPAPLFIHFAIPTLLTDYTWYPLREEVYGSVSSQALTWMRTVLRNDVDNRCGLGGRVAAEESGRLRRGLWGV
jgi:hypothetical protein